MKINVDISFTRGKHYSLEKVAFSLCSGIAALPWYAHLPYSWLGEQARFFT